MLKTLCLTTSEVSHFFKGKVHLAVKTCLHHASAMNDIIVYRDIFCSNIVNDKM